MSSSIGPCTETSDASPPQLKNIACEACRHRKSFCSKTLPKCDRCQQTHQHCIYKDNKKITVTEDYIRGLQDDVRRLKAEVRKYEQALGLPNRPVPRSAQDAEPTPPTTLNEEIDATSLLMRRVNIHDQGPYQGPAAADNLLSTLGRSVGIRQDEDAGTHSSGSRTFYDTALLPVRRLMEPSYPHLPPIEVARENFKAQYEYIGTIFSFCPPAQFEVLLSHGYGIQSQVQMLGMESSLAFSKLLVLLAFGQLYSINKWIGRNGPPGFDLFSAALQYLPDIHERGSVLFVETLALIGYFMQNLNRRDAALLYVGLAVRMALSLGLHEEVSSPGMAIDEATREQRRRVWWSVYSLDCILSAKSGAPQSVSSKEIGVSLPSQQPGEPDYCPAVALRHYTMLSQILSDISKNIYRKARRPGVKLLVADVHAVMQRLDSWFRNLPDQLKFSSGRRLSREAVSTMLHYNMCLNMTARPLFFHVVHRRLAARASPGDGDDDDDDDDATDWKEGLSATTISVIEVCIDAARKTVEMMSIAARVNLVATYGYMDSEHAFAAAIVLVMVCVAFPSTEKDVAAMKDALRLLRFMADRGNSHLADRLVALEAVRRKAPTRGKSSFQAANGTVMDDIQAQGAAGDSTPGGIAQDEHKQHLLDPLSPASPPSTVMNGGLPDPFSYDYLRPANTYETSNGDPTPFMDGPGSWPPPSSVFAGLANPSLGTALDATAPESWDLVPEDGAEAWIWENSFANPELDMDIDTDLTMLTESVVGAGGSGN